VLDRQLAHHPTTVARTDAMEEAYSNGLRRIASELDDLCDQC
jgi:hypothetical protein